MADSGAVEERPDPPATGWYPVPGNPEYQRYWNGTGWTSQRYWGLDPETTAQSLPAPDAELPGSIFPRTANEPRTSASLADASVHPAGSRQATEAGMPQEQFYSITAIVVPPVFIAFFAVVAITALPKRASMTVGIVAAILAVLSVLFFLQRPYVAKVWPDGSVIFKAVGLSKETTVSRISSIRLSTGGRGGSTWYFYFEGTRAGLGDIGGRQLARYVIERNPHVEYPRSRF